MEKIKNIKLPNGEVYELGGSGLDGKITNCITEIPQRIKYELKDGNLTLKAGSQFIIPNGFEADGTTRKFDYHTLNNDVTLLASNVHNTQYYVYNAVSGGFDYLHVTYSGTEHHTATSGISYNTKTNNVKIYSGANTVYSDKVSFPFVKVTSNGSVITVNEVFNGFGYVGSTVWVDKEVKGLIPNGRNEDGSLRNVEFTTSNVIVQNQKNTGSYSILLKSNSIQTWETDVWYKYDDMRNINYNPNDNTQLNMCDCGCVELSSGKITSFNPKQTFRAVDYNDFANTPHIVETYKNGASWYRVYSDGWIEQGGRIVINSATVGGGTYNNTTLTFIKPFSKLMSWHCQARHDRFNAGFNANVGGAVSSVDVYQVNDATASFSNAFVLWEAKGYIA